MRKKLFFWCIIFFIASNTGFAQIEATTKEGKKVWLFENGTWVDAKSYPVSPYKLEIPKILPNETIIEHLGYTLSYNEKLKQANWVAYELTKAETVKVAAREDQFKPDPKIKNGSATTGDYAHSNYDRGHLAPAADMGWNATAMAESFYYSNMSPQKPGFNRGIWKKLEEQVRDWAVANEVIYIVTLPKLTAGLATIGPNQIAVPTYFCKVILDNKEPSIKGIGFIMPNESSDEPLQRYAVSIDSVEKFTGIDFFPALPDEQEKTIESTLDLTAWNWTSTGTTTITPQIKTVEPAIKKPVSTNGKQLLVRCTAITKTGVRCKNKTTNLNQRCYLHQKI